ncbi:uncharacterized protein Z520_02048 [Fonsecaea multimorphosa CBS 102226]|uniref:Uncharacterized protein n=1 Tax=Fonsecaea multimorphosa CBS 102226 TaxID=1442371 RepID=A0A0D2KEZ9_9EURO|nr:uncharacterized protein Z520_02048 [Fonsecaea multimorphosa CBS 102226]KIY01910.1 hypothetical protein Z520_02048 [Fonsecaea multimorphosa CBS 102226]
MPLLLSAAQSFNIEVEKSNQNATQAVVPTSALTGPGVSTLTDQNTVSTRPLSSFVVLVSSAPALADEQPNQSSSWDSSDSTPWSADETETADFVLTLSPIPRTSSSEPSVTVNGTPWANATSSTSATYGSGSLSSTGSGVSPALSWGAPPLTTDSFPSSTITITSTTRRQTTLYVTNAAAAPHLSAALANSMSSDWTSSGPSPSKSWAAWTNSTASRIPSNSESVRVVTETVSPLPLSLTGSSTGTDSQTTMAISTERGLNSFSSSSIEVTPRGSTTPSQDTSAISVLSIYTPSTTSFPAVNFTTSAIVEPTLSLTLPSGVFLSTETNGVVYSYTGYVSANITHYVSALGPVTTTCVPTATVTYYDAQGNATSSMLQCGPGIGPAVTPVFGSTSLDDTAVPQAPSNSTTSLPTAPAVSLSAADAPAPTPIRPRPSKPAECSLIFGTSTPQDCTLTPAITVHASVSSRPTPRVWHGSGIESAADAMSKRDQIQTRVIKTSVSNGPDGPRPSTLITVPSSRSPPSRWVNWWVN